MDACFPFDTFCLKPRKPSEETSPHCLINFLMGCEKRLPPLGEQIIIGAGEGAACLVISDSLCRSVCVRYTSCVWWRERER